MSRFIRTVQLAIKSLMLHKLRSGLTMLGIVFGVFSVVAMLAIGEGASNKAQEQVLELGATNIIAVSVKPSNESVKSQTSSAFILRYGITRDDYKLIKTTIPTITAAIPVRETPKPARYLHREMSNTRLVGCTTEYLDVTHLSLARGRFISDQDQVEKRNVAVLAHDTAETLFPYEDPLGKAVKVAREYYSVVGITKSREASAAVGGSLSGQDFNKDIYIPIETFRVRLGDQNIQRQQGSYSAEQIELNQITLQVADREDVIPTAQVVRESLDRTHPNKDFSVVVPLELLRQADQIRAIFNVVLGSIAAISLVVGGIGIMNIMLATVTERTREIGIRRALGARQRDVTVQFLTETMVLAGSGGIIGIIMGLLTPYAFGFIQWLISDRVSTDDNTSELGRIFTDMEPQIAVWSLPVAFCISVGIGIIFGLYPARKAARLDPIEALRHE